MIGFTTDDDDLLVACRTVCHSIGIEVRPGQPEPAADAQSVGERLSEFAHRSGFYVREVTLSDGWWRRAAGEPLIGQLMDAGEPIALLPGRGRLGWRRPYELVEPGGFRRAVDDRVACGIGRRAWTLYRTLPEEPVGIRGTLQFCARVPEFWTEMRMVLVMGLLSALLRAINTDRVGGSRGPGTP